MRSYFFAVFPPSAVRDHIAGVMRDFAKRPGGNTVSWTPAGNLHITLAFLGHREEEDADLLVRAIAAGEAAPKHAFNIRLDGARTYDGLGKKPYVLTCSDPLPAMVTLSDSLHLEPRSEPCLPHMTIGRTPLDMREKIIHFEFRPDAFALVAHDPGEERYRAIQRWPLD